MTLRRVANLSFPTRGKCGSERLGQPKATSQLVSRHDSLIFPSSLGIVLPQKTETNDQL